MFYPEGGGQPADRGTLTLADGTVLHVTDVHETGGVIWHTVDALPEAAQPGICQGSCTATPEQVEEFLRKAL